MPAKYTHRWRGFSVLELLIVVAIVLTLAAMMAPRLMQARRAAQQASAFASIREISRAEELYSLTYGKGYSPLLFLGGASPCYASPESACLLDETLAQGRKDEYTFTVRLPDNATPATAYEIVATPDFDPSAQLSVCANRSGSPGTCRLSPPPAISSLDQGHPPDNDGLVDGQ